jgi:alkylresorcinol/alkylpyrone synthase
MSPHSLSRLSHPQILSIATAVPPHRVHQHEVRGLVHALFQEQYSGIGRLMPVFENTQIQTRHFARPLDWFTEQHSFVESTEAYVEAATELAVRAAREVMNSAQVTPEEIAMVVVVSTTGIATPSLDARLVQGLGLKNTTLRIPIWGLGCAGGVAGLARSAELVRTLPDGKCVLFVAVELCSLTFQRNDVSKSNIVASSLFADGAAALLLRNELRNERGTDTTIPVKALQILDSYSFLFDDTEDIMGWDVLETGLKVRFSRDIPTFIRQHLPATLDAACAAWGVEREDIKHFVLHGGGAKVLQAYQEVLDVPAAHLDIALRVLCEYGNMSSASVLFALGAFCASEQATGGLGVMVALGPGFSAEFVLFRW